MKSGLSFGAVLLAAGLTGATPSANNGVVRDLVVAEPALALRQAWNVIRDLSAQAIDAAQVCVLDIYKSGNPGGTPVTVNANFDFTSFCSSWMPAKTAYAGTTTVFFPSVITTTGPAKTTSTTKTAVTTVSSVDPTNAQIAYCPKSNAGAACNVTAWAGPTGAFHAGTEDMETCHQLCLTTSGCQSFQVSTNTGSGIIPQCNLYSVSAGGTTNGTNNFNQDPNAPWVIYDRNCPDALPAGCNQAVPVRQPATTAAPISVPASTVKSAGAATITTFVTVTYQPPSSPYSIGEVIARAPEENSLEVRDNAAIDPSGIIALIGTMTLSELCSCINGNAGGSVQTKAPATVYGPSYTYATATPTVVKTITAFSTVTTLVAGTYYSSLA